MRTALEELELARGNRTAGAGVFVMAKSHASDGVSGRSRATAATSSSSGTTRTSRPTRTCMPPSCSVSRSQAGSGGPTTPGTSARSLTSSTASRRSSSGSTRCASSRVIRDDADKLTEEVRKGGNALRPTAPQGEVDLEALDVELAEEAEAKPAPVMLPAGSLVQARASLLGTAGGDVPAAAKKKTA